MVGRMRTCMIALLSAVSSVTILGCGNLEVLSPEQEMPLIQQQYRRVGGSSSGIYANAKKVFDRLSITVTDERPGASLIGKMNIMGPTVTTPGIPKTSSKRAFIPISKGSARAVNAAFFSAHPNPLCASCAILTSA